MEHTHTSSYSDAGSLSERRLLSFNQPEMERRTTEAEDVLKKTPKLDDVAEKKVNDVRTELSKHSDKPEAVALLQKLIDARKQRNEEEKKLTDAKKANKDLYEEFRGDDSTGGGAAGTLERMRRIVNMIHPSDEELQGVEISLSNLHGYLNHK